MPMVDRRPHQRAKSGFFLSLLALPMLLLPGCAALKPDTTSSANLDKQIERQLQAYKLREEPAEREELSREEYERLGDSHFRRNDSDRAYFYYAKAVNMEPENVALLHKMGHLLTKNRKYLEAESVYGKLLSISALDARAHEGQGRALLGRNDMAAAEQAYRTALEIDPDLWQTHHFLGLIYSSQGHHEQAVTAFKRALTLQPQDPAVLNNLAVAYSLLGQFEQAEPILKIAAETTNEPKTFNNLATVYVRLGKYPEALTAFKKGAHNEAAAYFNMGVVYMAHEKYDEAVAALEKAISLNPQYYAMAAENLHRVKALRQ